ncbi:phospholipid methyltransferase-domain-containing protein [Radiomyces spectabilis]|uniref:phospholipid methyltransferase-domain-containing protein n=1 Tax=Radiomyces spectabilis TaxID=64574 RepID=UPI00221E8BDF|nr:phospholipid methyltransferase-domain-containing protein [Radiomyces spectabilis]KAI8385035.1 phospholipid methyltransferase-domain-containing protein [Radiomyces spectabilis]
MTYIDASQPSLYISLASILFNPIFWNIAARSEYRSKILTKLAGGNPRLGCYGLAITIFSLGIIRDYLYKTALEHQPTSALLLSAPAQLLAAALFLTGNVLVLSSMWALGVTGTYLGDYFGILMDHRVTGFPFNVCDNPMYIGSTLSFLATALWYGSPAGLFLTNVVFILYKIALRYEEPFTAMIYSKRDSKKQ